MAGLRFSARIIQVPIKFCHVKRWAKIHFFKTKGRNFGTRHKFGPDYSFAICDCLKPGLSNTKNRQNRTKKQHQYKILRGTS